MLLTRFTVVFCCEAYLAFSFVDALLITAVFLFVKKKKILYLLSTITVVIQRNGSTFWKIYLLALY